MKNRKHVLSLLLALLTVLGLCPLATFAEDEAAESATDEAKPYYTYYVQDGLTFLWSGEDYEIGETEQTVTALVNILNADRSIDKMMYGRQYFNLAMNDGNGGVKFNTLSYKKVNGGVYVTEDRAPILTDIVPTQTVDGVTVLTDMTLEVSQSYFDTVYTSTTKSYTPNRGYDGGVTWYGPLGYITHNKMPYKSVVVGSTRYFYGEYADGDGVATPFYFTSTPKTASNAKYTYENGVMTEITDEAVLTLIDTQANAGTLTVDGVKKTLAAAGNNYSSFPAIDTHGTAGVFEHTTKPFSTAKYDKAGQAQFMSNTVNQAFTTTMIYDYADVATSTTFDFTVGRDGVSYGALLMGEAYDATVDKSKGTYYTGTTGTYDNGTADDTSDDVTYTKNQTFLGFVGRRDANHFPGGDTLTSFKEMISNAIADEGANYAFTYGTNVAHILHAIRLYNRPLTEAEIAQNHFVDVAMKLGADLSYYDLILASKNAKKVVSSLYAVTEGKDEGDFTKESLEAAILEAYESLTPPYYKLYVQDGLIFHWTGEGNTLTETEQKVTSLESLVGDTVIDQRSYGRHYMHYYQGRSFTFYKTDKGVHNNGGNNYGLILTDLVPTRELDGEQILSDMTLEVSQMYPSSYQTKIGGTVKLSARNYDPGYMLFGALGNQSYTRVAYNSEYAYNESEKLGTYVPFYYVPNATDETPNPTTEILYVLTGSNVKANMTFYRKNSDGVMAVATKDADGNPISNVYCTATAVYAEGATGKIYYTYDPYYNLSTKDTDKTVTINVQGVIQGALNLPATDTNGMGPIAYWGSTALSAYDKPQNGLPNFMNSQQDQAFTTSMVFDYDESATDATAIPFTFTAGRDGAPLNTTSHTYDTTKDYTPAQKMWDENVKFDDDVTYDVGEDGKYNTSDDTWTVNEVLQEYAFSYGLGTAMTYYNIRLYDRALTEEEQAQNNFIDIAYQLDLNLDDYAFADDEVKASIHALTAGKSAADFDAAELQALIDFRVEGGCEAVEILDSDILSFDGYSVRMVDYAGLRAVFNIDREFVENAQANTTAKITEIGAIVALKGEYTLEDLTVDGGAGMMKKAVYEDGAWTKSANGFEYLFALPNEEGVDETFFALTTTFKNASEQTKEKYKTELLYRGYMTVTVGERELTVYTDMTAPSFDKISMCEVSKVFVLKSLDYKDVTTVQSVLDTCGIQDIQSLLMYEIDTQDTFPTITVSEHSAVGVMEAFNQRLSEMPEHVAVVPKLDAERFTTEDTLTLYVATDGSDTQNDGSFEKPFATLERALGKAADCGGATIYIRGGTYYLDSSVKIREQHSGTHLTPLFITNYEDEEVVFTTGLTFSGDQLVRADEADFLPENALTRLNTFTEGNSANVYALDLTALGLTADDLADYASGQKAPGLYVGDQNYRVARWPNYGATDADLLIEDGFVQTTNSQSDIKEVGKVTGGISSLYEANKDNPNNFFEIYIDQTTYADHLLTYDQTEVMDNGRLWMHGSVYEEWDNRTVNLTLYQDEDGKNYMHSDRAVGYGVKHAKANHVYFFNMLEDLDTALEYQVDVQNMVLYIYLEESPADRELTLCYQNHAAFDVNGVENAVLDGLNVERAYGLGVSVKNSDHVYVQDFLFRNLSGYAVQMNTSKMSGVTYSEFFACNGVSLGVGGDATVLEADRNFVQNNRFTNAGDNHGMTMGVHFSGVSSVISHNYFLETRLYVTRTYECIIEYNEFERGSQYTHDNGPIYGGDSSRALHVRYNYMHDLNNSGYGIYLDDMASGDYVYGNVVHYADGAVNGRCINLHNGSMHVIVNNICLNANGPGIQNNINYYAYTIDGVKTGGGGLGYRWRDIITNRLTKNGNYLEESVRYARFPMYAAYTEVVDRAIEQMNANAAWDHSAKLSTEVDELYVRTPLYNVYMNNISYSCASGCLQIPDVGRDTATVSNNITYADGTEGIFTDYANGDFTIPEDSIIYDDIPAFVAPDMSQMGVLAD